MANNGVFFLCAEEDEAGLKKSEVVNWYLKEIESEIDSEEELINKKALIEKVIHRLVHYVSSLFHKLVHYVSSPFHRLVHYVSSPFHWFHKLCALLPQKAILCSVGS